MALTPFEDEKLKEFQKNNLVIHEPEENTLKKIGFENCCDCLNYFQKSVTRKLLFDYPSFKIMVVLCENCEPRTYFPTNKYKFVIIYSKSNRKNYFMYNTIEL